MNKKIKPKEATAVINSLIGGVVPKLGVQHITVGRSDEVAMALQSLEEVKDGHSMVKYWIGDFGSGKSFMLHLLNTVALNQQFVVATTDFTPHTRLYSNDGKAQALYASLMNNLAVRTRPEGGALPVLLEKWIEKVMMQTASEHKIPVTDIRSPQYFAPVERGIMQTVNELTDVGAFDFGIAVVKYYEGYMRQDDLLRKNALRWLKGEYTTRTEARRDLGVGEIVNDRNYYEMLKNFCRLFVAIGYSGLVISLDEAINLYKIRNPGMRRKNYEKMMSIYNDCFQGKTGHLFINVAGTTDMLEDREKGFYSYDALKTRLQVNKFETDGLRDYAQPVIRLKPLSHDEIFVLLKKLKEIFDLNYNTQVDFSNKDIHGFMEEMYNKPGASDFLTPREVIRDFLNILNIIRQNPEGADKKQLIADIRIRDEREDTPEELAGETKEEDSPEDFPERETFAGEIKYLEKQIANGAVKNTLNRMSKVARIIQEKDLSAGELFCMRHAETVTKLLKQYHELEASGMQSDEMKDSLVRMAEAITLTGDAFEQELANLFRADMLDIDAESKAYLQSLKNRGLIDSH
ncbi:MAG: ATP-binding protein [Tannerella sp.]|jgi:hypothetical protein|nr:ATP-binding protein [Tannerella sp.]